MLSRPFVGGDPGGGVLCPQQGDKSGLISEDVSGAAPGCGGLGTGCLFGEEPGAWDITMQRGHTLSLQILPATGTCACAPNGLHSMSR